MDPSLSLPVKLAAGQTLAVPITFTPTQTGLIAGQLKATTDAGEVSFSLSGTGQAAAGLLQSTRRSCRWAAPPSEEI